MTPQTPQNPPNTLPENLTSPHQLRRMSHDQLAGLAEELRQRIIRVVSANGGHLASNLGIAELTLALHYVFDFSRDRLLWDVGHQCYAHKIITGRSRQFDDLRKPGGLSGFPSPEESPYDLFHTGHAGTAISTAAGLAHADRILGRDAATVAVVGDASIVNGLALEGLNNAALLNRQFLIVLNDNSMAIDRTRGALAEALEHVRMTSRYADFKSSTERLLKNLPLGAELTDTLKHIKEGLRTTLHGPKVFETLGFAYFGPIDGHDIPLLIRTLKHVGRLPHPVVLHVHTEKGRGCAYAVEDPTLFHSPSAYTVKDGQAVFAQRKRPTWTDTFASALTDRARKDPRIVALTAAMPDGTGLVRFRDALPERILDVGISESHALAAAAGMAKAGLKPVVAIYSTFMQRAFDQVFHECALQHLPVVLCMDRAGLVGSDGAVHHGFADLAIFRVLPGMTLLAPADAEELAAAMDFALDQPGPVALRYPRDEVPAPLPGTCEPFQLGRARTVREGSDANVLALGPMVGPALDAAGKLQNTADLSVGVLNARFVKPLDVTAITPLLSERKPLLVVEDHARIGGLGSAVLELAADRGLDASAVRLLGIPDRFVPHASRAEQLTEVGLDAETIARTLEDLIAHHQPA